MKIIIAGMSSVGLFLVKMISANTEYDVTVIDNCKAEVDKATDLYNVSGVCGSCSSRNTLLILLTASFTTSSISSERRRIFMLPSSIRVTERRFSTRFMSHKESS